MLVRRYRCCDSVAALNEATHLHLFSSDNKSHLLNNLGRWHIVFLQNQQGKIIGQDFLWVVHVVCIASDLLKKSGDLVRRCQIGLGRGRSWHWQEAQLQIVKKLATAIDVIFRRI